MNSKQIVGKDTRNIAIMIHSKSPTKQDQWVRAKASASCRTVPSQTSCQAQPSITSALAHKVQRNRTAPDDLLLMRAVVSMKPRLDLMGSPMEHPSWFPPLSIPKEVFFHQLLLLNHNLPTSSTIRPSQKLSSTTRKYFPPPTDCRFRHYDKHQKKMQKYQEEL